MYRFLFQYNIRIARIIRSELDRRLERHSINAPQSRVIEILGEQGGLAQSDIAECMKIKAPTASSMLRTMEQNGFISRERDDDDTRIIKVRLTTRGKHVYRDVIKAYEELDQRLGRLLGKDRVGFEKSMKVICDELGAAEYL